MEIFYNNKKLWLLKMGELGRQSNKALCVDENGSKVEIELNISLAGSYTFPQNQNVSINKQTKR